MKLTILNTKKTSKAEKRLAGNVSRSHKLHQVELISVVGVMNWESISLNFDYISMLVCR